MTQFGSPSLTQPSCPGREASSELKTDSLASYRNPIRSDSFLQKILLNIQAKAAITIFALSDCLQVIYGIWNIIIHNELVHLAESVTKQLQQQASSLGHHPASCASLACQLCQQQHRHWPLPRAVVTGPRSARGCFSALAKHSHRAWQRLEQGFPQPSWSFQTDFSSLCVPGFWDGSETGIAWEGKCWAVPTKILCPPAAELRTRLTANQALSNIPVGIE